MPVIQFTTTNIKKAVMQKQQKNAPRAARTLPEQLPLPNTVLNKDTLKERLFDRQDMEHVFGVSRGTIYNWCRKGLVSYTLLGRRKYFDVQDVLLMLQTYKQIELPDKKEGKKK